MGHIFHRRSNIKLPRIVKGFGAWCVDGNGKKYLDDGAGGGGLTCLGHSHAGVKYVINQQLERVSLIGAVLVKQTIHDAIAQGLGSFKGGFTHLGCILSCAVALAVQNAVEEDGWIENVRRQGGTVRGKAS